MIPTTIVIEIEGKIVKVNLTEHRIIIGMKNYLTQDGRTLAMIEVLEGKIQGDTEMTNVDRLKFKSL